MAVDLSYLLGILWSLLSLREEGCFWVRHRNRWYSEYVRERLGIHARPHFAHSRTGEQWRIKVPNGSLPNLEEVGWAQRNAQTRPYPNVADLDHAAFCRAWIEIHSTLDIAHTGRDRREMLRLRVFGNDSLIASMSEVIASGCELHVAKLQKTPGPHTKEIVYFGRSAVAVLKWVDGEPRSEAWWERAEGFF